MLGLRKRAKKIMLKYIKIRNFRSFKELDIDSLGQVNLISGKNNAGKTALLEAFQLHVSNFSRNTLSTILSDREELFSKNISRNELSPLRHFYFGHNITQENTPLILKSNSNTQELQFGRSVLIKEEDKLTRKFEYLDIDEAKLIGVESEGSISVINHSSLHGAKAIGPLFNDESQYFRKMKVRASREISDVDNVNFVPSGNIDTSLLSILWDRISLTDLEEHVLAGLQIIEPRISGITFVQQDTGSSRRIPIVRLSHLPEPVTLRSLGDGMTRICHIVLSLVNSINGTLLIDEFENGLHWSVQEKIWKVVFQLSKKHSIQVVATTHSNDCISSFTKSWNQDSPFGAFYRMELDKKETIKAVSYNLEDLEDSLNFDVEVR